MTSVANRFDCEPCGGAGGNANTMCHDCGGTGTTLGVTLDADRATVTTRHGVYKAEASRVFDTWHLEVRGATLSEGRCWTEWTDGWRFRRLIERKGRLEPGVSPDLLEASAAAARAFAAAPAEVAS